MEGEQVLHVDVGAVVLHVYPIETYMCFCTYIGHVKLKPHCLICVQYFPMCLVTLALVLLHYVNPFKFLLYCCCA